MTEQTYAQMLADAAETRKGIDEDLWPQYHAMSDTFAEKFPEFKKSDFKFLCDLVYYQGGYPSDSTPPREDSLADRIATALKLSDAIGRRVLLNKLQERGVYVTMNDTVANTDDDRLKAMKFMVDEAQDLQREICQAADSIKVEAAEVVEAKFNISKKNFVRAVNIAATKLKGDEAKAQDKLDAAADDAADFDEAVKPIVKQMESE